MAQRTSTGRESNVGAASSKGRMASRKQERFRSARANSSAALAAEQTVSVDARREPEIKSNDKAKNGNTRQLLPTYEM